MAKRTRRERRLEVEKQKQTPSDGKLVESEVFTPSVTPLPLIKAAEATPINNRKPILNFAQEYFYVYRELATILIITMLMFVVMVGLSLAM